MKAEGQLLRFGLIGNPLEHSFSRKYFNDKFERFDIPARYDLFPLNSIAEFPSLVESHSDLAGLNVTLPYKERIISYLGEISERAERAGAVNTIDMADGSLKGYNTDIIGFRRSIEEWLPVDRALVLGSGGASMAVCYALGELEVETVVVSRSARRGDLTYEDLNEEIVRQQQLIVQATPVGQKPKTDRTVPFPFEGLTSRHKVFDLIYNPDLTLFLDRARDRGCRIQNGYRMLIDQAEASWEIWTNK